MSDESTELLDKFKRQRSEAAFRELVRRHSPLVHGTALRRLGNDRAAAQDVMQEVFTLMARKAAVLDGSLLPGWLYRQTCRRASNHLRAENRRRSREQVAVEAMAGSGGGMDHPDLTGEVDEAMVALPTRDRDALVMRYLEARDFRAVGAALGVTEEAARKRVNRALEKLVALLRRKGVAVAAGSLGTTMNGMAGSPPSPAVIALVSARALEGIPTGTFFVLRPVLSAFASGIALSSLFAAAAYLRESSSQKEVALPLPPATAASISPSSTPTRKSSLRDLIEEIKLVKAGPADTLAALRLDTLLSRISTADIPEFATLAEGRLTPHEQQSCFLVLVGRWLNENPEAAMDFATSRWSGTAVNGLYYTSLVDILFGKWVRADLARAESWVQQTKRFAFSEIVADQHLMAGDAKGAIRFVASLPPGDHVNSCLKALVGEEAGHSGWMNTSSEQLLELYRGFPTLPDKRMARRMQLRLVRNLMQTREGEVMMTKLSPEEKFEVEIFGFGKDKMEVIRQDIPGGESVSFKTIEGSATSEEQLIETGLSLGLTRSGILEEMALAMNENFTTPKAIGWIDSHRNETNTDLVILDRLREMNPGLQAFTSQPSIAEYRIPEAIQWASQLSVPDQRLRVCRALFRKMIFVPDQNIEAFLSSPGLPADLVGEFRKIQSATP